jgi:hypothetical protein
VSRSISTGKPIVLNGNSKFSRDIKALGAEVTGLRGRVGIEADWPRCPAAGKLFRRPPKAREE